MPKGKKNVGTAPGGTTFVRPGRLPRPQLQQPSQRCTPPGGGTGSAPPGVRTEQLNPEARPTKLRRNGVQGTVQPTRSAPQPHESDCGAHGAPSEEEKSFGLRGGCKDGCGGENSRDGCWAGRGEDERPENRQPSGNQRPEAAAAGACPDAGAAGVSSAAVASCPAARSSAAAGASNRGTPSI